VLPPPPQAERYTPTSTNRRVLTNKDFTECMDIILANLALNDAQPYRRATNGFCSKLHSPVSKARASYNILDYPGYNSLVFEKPDIA
jgi:hypothetical protein